MSISYDGRKLKSQIMVEPFAGDCMKCIGEICHDLCDLDKYQNPEIVAMIEARLSEIKTPSLYSNVLPIKPTKEFMKNYSSDNLHTLSKLKREKTAGDRMSLMATFCLQLIEIHGHTRSECVALIKSYVDEHIIWTDIADKEEGAA